MTLVGSAIGGLAPGWKPKGLVYEYDPVAKTFTENEPGGSYIGTNAFSLNMVQLPSGQVLAKSYRLSNGNPIQDAIDMFGHLRRTVESAGATLEVLGSSEIVRRGPVMQFLVNIHEFLMLPSHIGLRTVGWIAQWQEMIADPEYKIGRPRQLYAGAARRDFVAMNTLPHERPYANELIGAHSTGPVTGGADWICSLPDHWIYKGTGMRRGDRVPGIIGWEWHGDPAPIPGLEVVATAPTQSAPDKPNGGTWTATVRPGRARRWTTTRSAPSSAPARRSPAASSSARSRRTPARTAR